MARKEQVEALMLGLGPVLDPLGIVAFQGESTWGLQVDEETAILIDFDEAQGKLVLSCDVGAPPSGDRTAIYELLLRHNYHWDRTGGIKMALDGPRGNVIQVFDLPTVGLDIYRLAGIIRGFANAARGWRLIVTHAFGDATTRSFESHMEGMIRG